MLENASLQRAKRRAGLEPELLGEPPTGGGERLERRRLAPGTVKRQGECSEEPLAERMLGHEPFELGHELGAEAAREVGLHPVLERRDAPILQVAGRSGSEWLGQHVRQRRPVPQRERVARLSCGAQLLEALEVKLARLDPDRVSGRAPHEPVPSRRQRPPQR